MTAVSGYGRNAHIHADVLRLHSNNSRSKYGNRKCTYNGITFDSVRERTRYISLVNDLEVTGLQRQIRFELFPKTSRYRAITYIADFTYYRNGVYVVEDVKGLETDVFKIKRKLFFAKYGYDIFIFK